jgi:hypothetical protein
LYRWHLGRIPAAPKTPRTAACNPWAPSGNRDEARPLIMKENAAKLLGLA